MKQNLITTLDWVQYYVNPKAFIRELRKAFQTTGFFKLVNHNMNFSAIGRGEEAFREFLTELPLEKRMQYSYPEKGFQVGYTPPGIEKGEFATVPDEKHFYHVYPDDAPYIKELPLFQGHTKELWDEFHKLSVSIMEAVAMSINEFKDFFHESPGKEGYSLLRGIHYPAREKIGSDNGSVTEGGNLVGMCASPHTDINMITLLLAREAGLELWHKGKWVPVTITNPNELIVNCGDMLQNLTNGVYKSGKHRVVCQENHERFSQPYFYHVHESFSIFPLVQFGDPKEKYQFQTAGQFLLHRLKQIGLVK